MGGRLVESSAVDIGKRASDSSAITVQWGVQGWRGAKRKKKRKGGESHDDRQVRRSLK